MSVMDKLKSIGISLKPYRRGPIGKPNFAMDIDGKHLRIWEGEATLSISTNKRKRQAVLTVHEKPRKISSMIIVSVYLKTCCEQWSDVTDESIKGFVDSIYTTRQIRERVALQIPNSRMRITKVQKAGTNSAKVTVEFSAPSTTTSFLVGFDTNATRPFISQLRNVVGTVQEAHNELLPKQPLAVGHKRQGEWFFNPVSETLSTQLTKNITRAVNGPIDGKTSWNAPTTHNGLYLYHNKKRYAIGMIRDSRKERHLPLFLPVWHEIIRNNEVVSFSSKQRWD